MAAAGIPAYKLFRTIWPRRTVLEAVFNNFPELAVLPKDGSFRDKYRMIAVGTAGPQGIGATYPGAKSNRRPSKAEEFKCSTSALYAVVSIEGDLIRRAKGDEAILVEPIKRETSLIIRNWKLEVARAIHGNGGGSLARTSVTTDPLTRTIAVSRKRDMRFVWPGMRLQSAATDGTSGGVPNAGGVTVATVNRGAGTFTIEEASVQVAIPGFVPGDFLFRDDLFGKVFPGLEAWNPEVAPAPGNPFREVDRAKDVDMLSGLRLDVRHLSPRAKAKALARAVYDNGGNPDLYILSTDDWADLEADLDSSGSLVRSQVPAAKIGKFDFGMAYNAIKITGPAGDIQVIASPNAPKGIGRMLTKDTWVLGYMDDLIRHIGENPVEDGSDSQEFRMLGDIDLYCEMPGHNARGLLSTPEDEV